MSDGEARRRFRAVVSYHGGPYAGWQSQPGKNAIQDHLVAAMARVHPSAGGLQGAGRTDAGVHAFGQGMHFDVPVELGMSGTDWRNALNAHLPGTIRIMHCREAEPGFHARFSATGKVYAYELYLGPVLPGPRAGLAWGMRGGIDVDRLEEAASLMEGYYDFASFSASRGKPELNPDDTRRRVDRVEVRKDGEDVTIVFQGEGFLYKMVRMMTGALVRCAQGKLRLDEIRALRDEPEAGRKSPLTAPAQGLYLWRVLYRSDEDE